MSGLFIFKKFDYEKIEEVIIFNDDIFSLYLLNIDLKKSVCYTYAG